MASLCVWILIHFKTIKSVRSLLSKKKSRLSRDWSLFEKKVKYYFLTSSLTSSVFVAALSVVTAAESVETAAESVETIAESTDVAVE